MRTFEKCVHSWELSVVDKEDNVLEVKKLCYGLTMTHDMDFPCRNPKECSSYKEKEEFWTEKKEEFWTEKNC